jgi:simple sugar transport system ATP-binding protein
MTEKPPLLSMRGIRVAFGPVVANDDVDLVVAAGEIHALLGENGAGKSTLMRVLAGLIVPVAGEVVIDGAAEPLGSPHEAMRLGIGMVHQHFMLVPTLTVAENVCLGLTSTGRFLPDLKAAGRRIRDLASRHGLEIDPDARIAHLSVAGRQRVEILKALFRGARILILDEPTAVLTPQETEGLFRILRALAAAGTAIIFISHKLNEVMALTETITVLRQGRVAATLRTADTDARALARLMVGADVRLPTLEDSEASSPHPLAAPSTSSHGRGAERTILAVSGLVCRDADGVARVDGASLEVGAGEIVGLAGVDGNGQQELAEAIVGLRAAEAGRIAIAGEDVTRAGVARRIALGLAHIPEDRHHTALVEPLAIRDNIALERIGEPPLSRRGWIDRKAVARLAAEVMAAFDIRASGPGQTAGTLSGGNQQKIVLGRALSRDPRLVVAVQPARGLDVGATAFVHRQLLARRAAGAGVLLVSTELDEILALSDRILVVYKGRITGAMARRDISVERLGLMMAGKAA